MDSTIVRAHQHVAGARTDPPPAPASKGAEVPEHQGETPWQSLFARLEEVVLEVRAWAARAADFTTKLHLSADGRCRPLSLIVTPGQRADCTQFKPVLEKISVPRTGPAPRQARHPRGRQATPCGYRVKQLLGVGGMTGRAKPIASSNFWRVVKQWCSWPSMRFYRCRRAAW